MRPRPSSTSDPFPPRGRTEPGSPRSSDSNPANCSAPCRWSSRSYEVGPLVADTSPPSGAYTPTQIQQAYRFNQISFDNGMARRDDRHRRRLRRSEHPGRPGHVRQPSSACPPPRSPWSTRPAATSLPAADSTGGWEMEESLDVEWAHAIAPGAKILLVEANSANAFRPADGA